jgi:hypothetical protein
VVQAPGRFFYRLGRGEPGLYLPENESLNVFEPHRIRIEDGDHEHLAEVVEDHRAKTKLFAEIGPREAAGVRREHARRAKVDLRNAQLTGQHVDKLRFGDVPQVDEVSSQLAAQRLLLLERVNQLLLRDGAFPRENLADARPMFLWRCSWRHDALRTGLPLSNTDE